MPNAAPITLLTAFQPFQGRGVNGSSTILRWLRQHWEPGTFRSRILPVAWGEAPQRLQRLLETHRPARYLGIGEGQPDRIAWEMLAHNEHNGTDETGSSIPPSPIIPNGPPTLASTWPMPPNPHLSLLPPDTPFVPSTDAGRFLCNRVLWQALSQGTTSAFLHLPPQGTDSNAAYIKKYAAFVESLLTAER